MKSLRKSFLTLLALTLFGGAGAWAQTTVTWTASQMSGINISCNAGTASGNTIAGITVTGASGVPGGWYGTFIDFGPNGGPFTFTSTVGDITSIVISASYISATEISSGWTATASTLSWSGTAAASVSLSNPTGMADGITQIVFTIASAEIELTPSNNNHTWTLGQTPDYDLELQVEYYEAHALKEIPAGWTVKVNGVDKTAAIDHDSLMIVETDSVTLVPAGNPRRVKSVTLADEGPATQTVNIGGVELQIAEGDTWAQIIARNPTKIEDFQGWVERADGGGVLWDANDNFVNTSDPYDPSQQSHYHWVGI